MATMLQRIERYWTRRAPSYSQVVQNELARENERRWMEVITPHLPRGGRVLDVGTGPGFFAIGLARRGYEVSAVDYTQAMLGQARDNAGPLAEKIDFYRMDAHSLDFAGGSFDAIVTRNLTWNLERPQDAYADWHRVLRPGGVLLNFDAGWYNYLFDEEKNAAFRQDRLRVEQERVFDFNDYDESALMEEISRELVMSRFQRPQADILMLGRAGFSKISADTEVWRRVWDEEEKINFASTPLFMLIAEK